MFYFIDHIDIFKQFRPTQQENLFVKRSEKTRDPFEKYGKGNGSAVQILDRSRLCSGILKTFSICMKGAFFSAIACLVNN